MSQPLKTVLSVSQKQECQKNKEYDIGVRNSTIILMRSITATSIRILSVYYYPSWFCPFILWRNKHMKRPSANNVARDSTDYSLSKEIYLQTLLFVPKGDWKRICGGSRHRFSLSTFGANADVSRDLAASAASALYTPVHSVL